MTRQPTPRSVASRIAIIALGVVTADAASKAAAAILASGHSAEAVIHPVQNPDFSLSLASASFPVMLALSGLGILLFGGYAAWAAGRNFLPAWIPGLLIGGSLGNLTDRILFGAVHDWLALFLVVINLADLAVLAGVLGWFSHRAFAHLHPRLVK